MAKGKETLRPKTEKEMIDILSAAYTEYVKAHRSNRDVPLYPRDKYDSVIQYMASKIWPDVEGLRGVLNSSLLKFNDFSLGARQEPSFEQYVKVQSKKMAEMIKQALKGK